MRNFHDYYFGLSGEQRQRFVEAAGTTIGYAERVAGGFRLPSIPTAMAFVRASKGRTSLKAIINTYESRNGPV
jgi:hypothetical protein